METNDLKERMISELLKEIRGGAATEITALQLAKAKVQEIEDLRKQYIDKAEDLRVKMKEKAPGGDVSQIKAQLESRNKLAREIDEAEQSIKEIDENFLPGALAEASKSKDRLYAFVNPAIFRHRKVWQQKVTDLCVEIDAIMDSWIDALSMICNSMEVPKPSMAERQTMSFLVTKLKFRGPSFE